MLIAADPAVQACLLPSFNLSLAGDVYWILIEAFFVNVILFVFDLIPIPPLDGYGVAEGLFRSHAPRLFEDFTGTESGSDRGSVMFLVLPNFFYLGFSISWADLRGLRLAFGGGSGDGSPPMRFSSISSGS